MSTNLTRNQAEREPVFPVKAELQLVLDGQRVKREYTIMYRGITSKIERELTSALEANEAAETPRHARAVELSVLVERILELNEVDAEGNAVGPLPMSVPFFENMLSKSRDAIFKAINEDIEGPNESAADSAPSS